MAYKSVIKIEDQSFQNGEKYHVGMKRLEAVISWEDDRQPQFIPFITDQGHQAMRVIIEPIK